MTNFANEALRLASLGYQVFPCKPGGKTPLTEHGCKDATTSEDQIAEWWGRWPEANIAVSTDGLLVVDVDTLEDGSRNAWADDIDRHASLALSAISLTPRGGTHYWFAQGGGQNLRNTASKIAPRVDTRGNGGYVIVPPSRTDVGLYQWSPFFSLDCGPQDLAIVPDWLLNLLSESPRAVSEYLRSTTTIVEGSRNSMLCSMAGHLRHVGFSGAEIAAALLACNRERCSPPLEDSEVHAIAESVARYEPDQIATAMVVGGGVGEPLPDDPEPPIALPGELLNPGGLLGEIIDHNLATAHRRQPELALAGALALLSTITGRKIEDDRRTRTNLYVLGLAESGAGKEHARQVNKEILSLADPQSRHLGPEGIGSGQGVVKSLASRPSLLFQLDEFGKVLSAIRSAKAAPHLQSIPATLLRLYSSARSVYVSDAVVDDKRVVTIDQPHCTVYGTTVPKSFFAALTPDSLRDGFVSRLLVLEASDNLPPRQAASSEPMLASIVDQVRWWIEHKPSGNISDATGAARVLIPDAGAEAVYDELERSIEAEIATPGAIRELWVRVAEQARKLGLLFRVSRVADAKTIDESSARLGASLALIAARRIAWLAKRHVAESESEDQCKRVLRIIAGEPEGLTANQLTRKTQWMRRRDRQDVIATLLESGQVYIDKRETSTRPATVYRLAV